MRGRASHKACPEELLGERSALPRLSGLVDLQAVRRRGRNKTCFLLLSLSQFTSLIVISRSGWPCIPRKAHTNAKLVSNGLERIAAGRAMRRRPSGLSLGSLLYRGLGGEPRKTGTWARYMPRTFARPNGQVRGQAEESAARLADAALLSLLLASC